MDGTYDEKSDVLSLRLVDFMPPFQFTRRKGRDAVGFFPRISPEGEGYVYRKPITENDGWATASLADAGLDQKLIFALVEKILGANLADNSAYIQSLLIARHGKLVLEEYFYGFDKERTHDMRSASKTFAPVLVGIARDHGAKLDPDTPVYALFRQYKEFANWDERKRSITLRHIMTMTAGNACDDNDDSSPGNEDHIQNQREQPDWYKFALDTFPCFVLQEVSTPSIAPPTLIWWEGCSPIPQESGSPRSLTNTSRGLFSLAPILST
jgi:hypothetical protein